MKGITKGIKVTVTKGIERITKGIEGITKGLLRDCKREPKRSRREL